MNPFAIDSSDFQFLIDSIGETVTIDNVEQKAIVNNAKIGDYEDKYIYTLDSIQRGNLIVYNGKNYLIVSDVTEGKVYNKALMRHCNYTIQIPITEQRIIGYTPFGEEIYETIVIREIFIPAIIDKYAFKVDNPAPIRVPDKQIIVTVQDNETNKSKFTVNTTFEVMEQTWKVIDVDMTRNGLLILTCELS
ncbi:Ig domain-containing protein [Saccharococcus caldoxylosilyticus]|uniref:Ig domain-containing protein n=1 Tax=Saccharococcus caldoxylosilyticus TaxID=81408 RepID=UPI003D33AF49